MRHRPRTPLVWALGLLPWLGCHEAHPRDARAVWQETAFQGETPAPPEVTPVAPLAVVGAGATPPPSASRLPAPGSPSPSRSPAPSSSPSPAPGSPAPAPSSATVETGPTHGKRLRLTADEAVALALTGNPTLRALRHQRGVAEGTLVSASVLADPTLELDALHLQNLQERAWAAELAWVPPQPGLRDARRQSANADIQAATQDVAELSWALEMNVRATHAELRALREKRILLEEALGRRREVVRLVEKRMAAGASTRLDLNLAELALGQMDLSRAEYEAQSLDSARQLASLLGVAADVEATGALPEEAPATPSLDALAESALAARPALKAQEARVASREQALRAEDAQRWPWFRLSGRYRSNETREHPDDWMVGAQVTLPIFNRNRGGVAVATALRDREEDLLHGAAGDVWRDLAFARAQVELRRANLARFRTTLAGGLSSREALLTSAARGGQLDVVAWLAAEDVIARTRLTYCDLQLAQEKAWLSLERAVGKHLAVPRGPDAEARSEQGGSP